MWFQTTLIVFGTVVSCDESEQTIATFESDPTTETQWSPLDSSLFISSIVSFEPGSGAGFGQDKLPDVILGVPEGGGLNYGGLDVLSLGKQGSVIIKMGAFVYDGPGPDFVVFENPFAVAGSENQVYVEPATVAVSKDGILFETFPCAEHPPWQGCAGITPVYASTSNHIDPRDLSAAGGDAFDLQSVGLERIRYIQVTDRLGKGSNGQAGFDLDAIVAIHTESP